MLCVLSGEVGAAAAEGTKRPNIVFIVIDDLGWSDLGCYGSTFHETPHLDALADRSVRFTHAYAAGAVCSPTRASILTGRHPVRVDITDWIPGQDAMREAAGRFLHVVDQDHLALEERTLAEVLRDAHYQTYAVGKWHLGGEGFLPTDQGFDINIGGFHGGSPPGGYYAPFGNPYLKDREEGEYLTERLTTEAISLIRHRDPQRPFFLYFSDYNVHTPIEPYRKRVDHYREKARGIVGEDREEPTPRRPEHGGKTRLRQDDPAYASMVAAVDDSVGAIIAALEEGGIAEETILVFTSDNGGLSTLAQIGPTSNEPLRAGKGWLYEGGIRVPLIVHLPPSLRASPDQPPQRRGEICARPVMSTDFFPTLLNLAGIPLPDDIALDGISFAEVLQGSQGADRSAEKAADERAFYWHYPHYHGSMWTPGAAIRRGDWKLIEFYHLEKVELYHLGKDPQEQHNLWESHSEKGRELREALRAWQVALGATMPVPRPASGER